MIQGHTAILMHLQNGEGGAGHITSHPQPTGKAAGKLAFANAHIPQHQQHIARLQLLGQNAAQLLGLCYAMADETQGDPSE